MSNEMIVRIILYFLLFYSTSCFPFEDIDSLSFSGIFINEIMPSNSNTISDEDGDYPDWIELYNCNNYAIDIKNLRISDDYFELNKWIFPSIIIEPNGFLLIYASGKDRLETPILHTNFKISALGEPVIISDSTGWIVDEMNAGQITNDISFGRKPNGSNQIKHFFLVSPGLSNDFNSYYYPIVASKSGGFYTAPFILLLESPTNTDVNIFYTLDGSEPHPNSSKTFLYSNGIDIYDPTILVPNNISMIPTTPSSNGYGIVWSPPSENISKVMVVRARSFFENQPSCKTITNTYIIDSNIFEKFSLPVFSINTDSINLFAYDSGIYVPGQFYDSTIVKSGNYFQTGIEWEKKVHIEYFSINGQALLKQDAGMRMHGNLTLTNPQKSVMLYAKNEYGIDVFQNNLFCEQPYDEYKRFILRTTFLNSNALIKDDAIHELVKNLSIDRMAVKPVLVFLNGEYWGIHCMREKQDKFYIEQHHSVNHDSIDIIEAWGIVEEGNLEAFNELYNYILNNDLNSCENYSYVTSKIDIDSYIDYYITEIYFGNMDWPGNNYKYWRPRTNEGKWRYLLYDLDASFNTDFNSLVHATADTNNTVYNPKYATMIFRKLLQNEAFKFEFLKRYEELVNTLFSPESIINIINELETIYSREIDQHINRWNYPISFLNWQLTVDDLRKFAKLRPCYMKDFIIDFFNLEENELNFNCTLDIVNDTLPDFVLYPNPASSHITLQQNIYVTENQILTEIFNQFGIKVREETIVQENWKNTTTFNISDLNPGIYILRVSDRKKSQALKFIKL